MKHNAGEWKVVPVFTDDHLYSLWHANNYKLLPLDMETRRANARLMSAAPDMLAALIDAQIALRAGPPSRRTDNDRRALIVIDAAIAKATEEQP